ncbi:hypothetical protein [Erythrobacter sp.]|nr:hypothetical protein [Erythrobacter sp.]MBO6527452.1 hypothetical protein [Erythrobacter sp.]MBO6530835.1 hypothetical protein [Erythrobacter sp.]
MRRERTEASLQEVCYRIRSRAVAHAMRAIGTVEPGRIEPLSAGPDTA